MNRLLALIAAAALAVPTFAQETKDPAPPAPATPPPAKPSEPSTVPDQIVYKYVKMSTSMGDIYLQLNETKAPVSTANFIKYSEDKHYDGTIFHRVIDGFMIQGGGFTPDLKQKPTREAIKNEWQNGLKNKKYTIAMARTSAPDSATAQFFINVTDNSALDNARPSTGNAAYAVFGEVVAGREVVDKIRTVKTQARGQHEAVPVEPVVINTVTVIKEEEAKAAMSGASAPKN